MTFWLCAIAATCAQDPAEPAPDDPGIGRPFLSFSCIPPRQDGGCDGKCHEGLICAEFARQCGKCKVMTTPCGPHAWICQTCAHKEQVCPFCGKSKGGAAAKLEVDRIQRELSRALPGHRVGRELPNKLAARLLPRVKFFTVFHSGHPCDACVRHSEPLAAVVFQNDKDRNGTVSIVCTENELADLLKRQKLSGGAEAALCAAQLVQALWLPDNGGLEPSDLKGVTVDGKSDIAAFEYKKGDACWALRVRLDREGAFIDLHVENTGRTSE